MLLIKLNQLSLVLLKIVLLETLGSDFIFEFIISDQWEKMISFNWMNALVSKVAYVFCVINFSLIAIFLIYKNY